MIFCGFVGLGLLTRCTRLRELRCRTRTPEALYDLSPLIHVGQRLQSLTLNLQARDLEPLRACTQLTRLYAIGSVIDVSPLSECACLQWLVLDYPSIGYQGLRELSKLVGLASLKLSDGSFALHDLCALSACSVRAAPLVPS